MGVSGLSLASMEEEEVVVVVEGVEEDEVRQDGSVSTVEPLPHRSGGGTARATISVTPAASTTR